MQCFGNDMIVEGTVFFVSLNLSAPNTNKDHTDILHFENGCGITYCRLEVANSKCAWIQ